MDEQKVWRVPDTVAGSPGSRSNYIVPLGGQFPGPAVFHQREDIALVPVTFTAPIGKD